MLITFKLCAKFICLRVKIASTLSGALSVSSIDVDKSEEPQAKRGKVVSAKGAIWKK